MNPASQFSRQITIEKWLPGVALPSSATLAELSLIRLCFRFWQNCPVDNAKALSAEFDNLALGCVFISRHHGAHFSDYAIRALESCFAKVEGRFWGDRLPWLLALDACQGNRDGGLSLDELTANLDHHNSSIRWWMMRLAWLVRSRLDVDVAGQKLLGNVANTLGGWSEAAGLCAALHESDDAFWISAEAFRPDDFANQYRERLELLRTGGLARAKAHFQTMEREMGDILAVTTRELVGADKEDGGSCGP